MMWLMHTGVLEAGHGRNDTFSMHIRRLSILYTASSRSVIVISSFTASNMLALSERL